MNAPHVHTEVHNDPALAGLLNTLTSQYREAIAPVLMHHLEAMTKAPADSYIEKQDISEKIYLVKPVFIPPAESGLEQTFVILLTPRPIRDSNCYFLTYERKGVFDPKYAMPFLLRLFTNHPDKSIMEQRRASLLDVFEFEIQRQLKVMLEDHLQDPTLSGLLYVSILPIDPASLEQLNKDKEDNHV
jgi:hypothetical protein